MSKPKIYSMWDRPEKEPTPQGNEMEPVYELRPNEKGVKELVKTGETNIREKIQQYKDDCDISLILARAVIDPSVLNQRQGFYADITEMPKSLAEAQSMIISIKNQFNALPVEERAKFDYSAEKFVAEYGTSEWAKKIGLTQEATKPIQEALKEATPTPTKGGDVINES